MIATAAGLLDLGSASHVLEVGVGGGVGLGLLLPRLPKGRLIGTELSDVLLQSARRKFATAIRAGRLDLVHAAVDQLPCLNGSINAVLTVNTIYFWREPERGLAELYRVLRPGGQLLIALRPVSALRRYKYTEHGLTLYEPEQIESLLERAGFTDTRLVEYQDDRLGYYCAMTRRP
jgi:SAM-dependent methyltransferase